MMPTTEQPFDWSDFLQRLAGAYVRARMPTWIDSLTGARQPTFQQNTDQLRAAYNRAFDEEEARLREELFRRGMQDSPQIAAATFRPLSTQRALTMAQLDAQGDQARYLDEWRRYQEHQSIVQSLMPYLFQYEYPGSTPYETVTRPGLIPYLWDLVFNRQAPARAGGGGSARFTP